MKTKWGISGSVLKWFAVITMAIDHFGASILETYVMNVWGRSPLGNLFSDHWNELLRVDRILRYIGRPAFPIFCFCELQTCPLTVWLPAGQNRTGPHLYTADNLLPEIPSGSPAGKIFLRIRCDGVFPVLLPYQERFLPPDS